MWAWCKPYTMRCLPPLLASSDAPSAPLGAPAAGEAGGAPASEAGGWARDAAEARPEEATLRGRARFVPQAAQPPSARAALAACSPSLSGRFVL